MYYYTNELTLDLPEIVGDRSINILTATDPQRGVPFQIIISRDLLLGGETLQQCFDRQVGQMTRQTQAFKASVKRAVQIGPDKLEGMEIESSFVQASTTFHQIQAMWVVKTPQMMVLTLSSQIPIHDGHRKIWQHALDSLHHRPADPQPTPTNAP
ncbi:MAG: DUF1795 domain-containing protein [Polyangiaceae bacterium]|nr:DUF1795 domain-containing protein [Polyangiaceae bacterium]